MGKPTLSESLILDRCPHCKVDNPNLTKQTHIETNNYQSTDKRIWGIYKCNRCGKLVTAPSRRWSEEILDYYPQLDKIDDNIPSPARDYLVQANDTIHAPAGSIMLSASAVDSMLKIKNYKDGNLFSRINKAAQEHLITEGMSKWAHQVRLDANDQRHSDENAGLPTIDDARHTLEFAKALGQFLFVLPSKVEKGLEDTKAANPPQ